jgi:hypothetical protein
VLHEKVCPATICYVLAVCVALSITNIELSSRIDITESSSARCGETIELPVNINSLNCISYQRVQSTKLNSVSKIMFTSSLNIVLQRADTKQLKAIIFQRCRHASLSDHFYLTHCLLPRRPRPQNFPRARAVIALFPCKILSSHLQPPSKQI